MSFGTVVESGKFWKIECKPIPKILDELRTLPDRKFDYNNKFWTVPIQHRDEVERFAKRHNLDFGYKHVEEIQQDFIIDPLPELTVDIPTKREMRPYQRPGVAYTMMKQRLIMGDDMGLGKTMQAIVAMEGLHITGKAAYPCLVICPSSVKLNWQREVHMNIYKKAIILTDSVKYTFPEFYRVGMAHFFIVNYESLKKYFVERIDDPGKDATGRKKPLRINHIHFKEKYINFFKSVIIDESHRCFPYKTKILTNKGWLKIGEIVEKRMNNLLVASCNLSDKTIFYNKITNLFRNELSDRKIYCVKHNEGKFYATENHKIYTDAGRYKEVREIKSGEGLYLLRDHFYDTNIRQKDSSILLKKLRIESCKRNSRNNAFNRSGRIISQILQGERSGRIENQSLEIVRVESCKVYQSGSDRQFEAGYRNREFVYDIEVDVTHNYFAEGILVSNCKSLSTKATKFTKGICTGKETIFELTGTPVINKPKDLIAQLGIIERLKDFGGYKEFERLFCSGPKEASNLKQLNYMLNKTCFYRRNKTDPEIKKYLPDKMRQIIECELNEHSRSEYNHAQADLESYMRQYKESSDEQIKKSMKGEVMVKIGILKNISARGKLKDAFDFIDDVIESGQKIVVFANLTEVISKVQERFPKSVRVTGSEDDKQKQAAVDRFQNDPDMMIIVCNLRAAGVGITLTASSQVAFIEFGWHSAIMDQAEDRCYRLGAHSNVMCSYFLGKNTIDEWNYNLIQTKREIANAVTGNEDDVEVNVIDNLMNLFTQK